MTNRASLGYNIVPRSGDVSVHTTNELGRDWTRYPDSFALSQSPSQISRRLSVSVWTES